MELDFAKDTEISKSVCLLQDQSLHVSKCSVKEILQVVSMLCLEVEF